MMRTKDRRWIAALISALLIAMAAVPANAALFGEEDYSVLAPYTQVLYDYESGLPTNGVNDVIQTRDGYLWIAGYAGLIRYDGDAFTVFGPKADAAITSLSIISLFEDSAGRLWIGTNDKGAMVYADHQFRSVLTMPTSVSSFAEAQNGDVLIGTKEGVYRVAGDAEPAREFETGALDMLIDSRDQLWFIDTAGYLHAPDAAGVSLDEKVKYSALFEDRAGNIYLSCQEGPVEGDILMLEQSADGYAPTTIKTGLYRIHDYCETLNGQIWVCSDSGIGYVEGKGFHYATGAVLYSSLEAITLDHEGNLWIASSRNGLLQLIRQKVTDLTFAGNLTPNIVNTAAQYRGDIYIGTDNKLEILDADYRQVHNQLTNMLSVVRIRCMLVDSKDRLWIGEYEDYGLVRYDESGEIISINTGNSAITSNKVRVIIETRAGDIVAGTSGGVNVVRGTDVAAHYAADEGLTNGVVLSLAEDKGGRLFVGTDGGGIFTIEGGEVAPYDAGELASQVILRMMYDEENDGLWISTSAALYYHSLADGALTSLPHIYDALHSTFDIARDDSDRLWLMCTNGIAVGTREQLLTGEGMTVLNQNDGLPYQTTANSFSSLTADGHLFLCGTKGLGLIDVNDYTESEATPMLIVEQVTSDNQALDLGAPIALLSDAKRLTFRAIVPHFSPKSEVRIEYFLENFDDEWQTLSTEGGSEITYTNLKGGNYTFLARAANGDGVYGDTLTIPLKKDYLPLERPGVIAALVAGALLLVALIVYLIMRARAQKILRRQQEYKQITDQAINTISNAIDAKDSYTEGHSERVAAFSVEIGRRMGMSEDELEQLKYIALLHDIGKIGIADNILNKPGRLTDDEFAVMRSHTSIGGDILKDFTAIEHIGEGANCHHEKYDGTGYPRGLKGDEISLTSRIICVCDTYDAMATARSYKDPRPADYMISELKRCSGTQFDPEVANIMIQLIEEGFTAGRKSIK